MERYSLIVIINVVLGCRLHGVDSRTPAMAAVSSSAMAAVPRMTLLGC